jgi:hypothetical protein
MNKLDAYLQIPHPEINFFLVGNKKRYFGNKKEMATKKKFWQQKK